MDTIWWTLLVLILLFSVYAAFVIKNEKTEAMQTAIDLTFHGFIFKIPRWWTATTNKPDFIQYERTDTKYDWRAGFHWIPANEYQNPQDIFEMMALEKKIVFDPETAIVKSPTMLENLQNEGIEALRVEGTATEDNEHRIYYDALVLKAENGFVFLESRSSILNGLLEGPFFEQCLLNTKKAH